MKINDITCKVSRKAKIRNQYNQVPYLTQDITWESDKNIRELHIQASQEVSPFPAGDHKIAMKIQDGMLTPNFQYITGCIEKFIETELDQIKK